MKHLLTIFLATQVPLLGLVGCGVQPNSAPLSVTHAASYEADKAVLSKRVIVGFAAMPNKAAISRLEQASGTKLVRTLSKVRMAVFEAALGVGPARVKLLQTAGVQFVESDLLPEREQPKVQYAPFLQLTDGSGDPNLKDEWFLDKMGISKVWETAGDLKSVTVAVVDTGVDLKHPDLQGVLVDGFNAANPGTPPQDQAGHGTMTAGLVGAVANNGLGIAGVAPNSKIMPIKTGNSVSSVVDGMIHGADHADMITMSLSFKPHMSEYPIAIEATKRAANYVMGKGIPMVCSMGNTGDSSKNVPSYFAGNDVPGLIAVGATDEGDKVTSFSTFGNWTSVSAPGKRIMTLQMGGGTGFVDGTSFSTPITAGVMALMLGHGAAKDPAAIKAKLQKTALDIGTPGSDDKSGAGRVDAFRAVME